MDIDNVSTSGGEEDLSKYKGDEGVVLRWLKEFELVKNSKGQKAFESIGVKIVKNYRNADALVASTSNNVPSARVMLNVLWSNVQILKPTLYARMPKVVVERRFKDSDPIGRLACQIAERATSYAMSTQQDRFNYAVRAAVEDRLLAGRGTVWLRYDAEFEEATDENGEPITDDTGEAVRTPKPNSEKVVIDPVNWLDYYESLSRNQYEVRWRARRVYMTRSQLITKFGEEIGKAVELNDSEKKRSKLSPEEREFLAQAEVLEIWDEESKRIVWITECYKDRPLRIVPDSLRLKDFWPCPLPLVATTTTDSTYPTPDYKIYERLADEVDYVTKRISSLIECIRFVGATAAQYNQDVKNMLKLSDGQLWPIDNWTTFAEKGGLKGAMDWLPFDQAVAAIPVLLQYRDDLLAKLDFITGIPDIVRGDTNPNETAEAQQKKSHWTTVKISEHQGEVQRFCREIISKMAEIIFEPGLFSDETISLMCGVSQMPPEDQQNYQAALQLLRDDRLRTFRVDIETDSTLALDEEDDKQSRMEYVQAITTLVQNIQNVQAFRPELLHPMMESALFAARAFRTGRPLEGSWERAIQQIEDNDAAVAANPPQPPPDYEGQKLQLMQQELQFKQELESQKLQLEGQKQQADFGFEAEKLRLEAIKIQSKAEVDAVVTQLDQFKQQFVQFVEVQRLELEKFETVNKTREALLEERRLAQESKMETLKLAQERSVAMPTKGSQGGSSSVNIHVGEKSLSLDEVRPPAPSKPKRTLHRMRRQPDGELMAISEELPDDPHTIEAA